MTRPSCSLILMLACASQALAGSLPQVPPAAGAQPAYVQQARQLARQATGFMGMRPARQMQAHDAWAQAWRVLAPYMAAHGGDAPVLHLAGQLLARMRRYDQAFGYLQQAHLIDPSHPGYLFDMASCRFNQGQWQESLGYWRQLETMEAPTLGLIQRATISFNRGACANELDLVPEALAALDRAVTMAPDQASQARFRFELGAILLNNGKYARAAKEFAKLVDHNSQRWDYPYYLGVCELELGKLDDAERQLLAARRLNENNYRILEKLGNLWFQRQKLDHAEGYFMLALEKNAYAEDALRKLMVINRNHGDPKTVEELREKYKVANDLSTSITEELRALRRRVLNDRKAVSAHRRRVELFLKHDRKDDANKALCQLLAVKPRDDWALLNLSRLLMQQGRLADALFELEKVVEKQPSHGFANRDIGRLLGSQRRFQQAVPYLLRALNAFQNEKPPRLRDLGEVHTMLASCFLNLRDPGRAKVHQDAAAKMAQLIEQQKQGKGETASRPAKAGSTGGR